MIRKFCTSVGSLPAQSIAVLLVVLLSSTSVSADNIDLSGLPDGDQGSDTIVTPEGTFLSLDGNWFKANTAAGDFLCPMSAAGCGSWMLSFVTAVTNLIFDVTGHNDGDEVEVSAVDSAGATLTTFTHASADPISLLGFSDIQSVSVSDRSSPVTGGYGYGNFRFGGDRTVPAPGVLSLLLLGLVGIRLARRRTV